MKTLGNIIWFLFGGVFGGLAWILAGCLWCITIVGIPIGMQCFKFSSLAFWPFGKEVVFSGNSINLIANVFWLLLSGIPMAIAYFTTGLIFYITIIGIPFGSQFFKLGRLALMPFGAEIIEK